jgi:hypothetical protein
MPARNAFDFIEKPQSRDAYDHKMNAGMTKGHERLRKLMTSLKKSSVSRSVNTKLAIAKIYD